jgi:hypothetical protein
VKLTMSGGDTVVLDRIAAGDQQATAPAAICGW